MALGLEQLICRCSKFFFSSRRRHTRFDCDWSSDVCSSDLTCGRKTGDRIMPSYSPELIQIMRAALRSEEHTSELQSQSNLVCRLLLEKKIIPFAAIRTVSTIAIMHPVAITITRPAVVTRMS